jgi:hypothetical protein
VKLTLQIGDSFDRLLSTIFMANTITYHLNGVERTSSSVDEMRSVVSQLTKPKASLITNPDGLKGYLDFHVLDNGSIEMELWEGSDDDFAIVDIPGATSVIETVMTDARDLPLRRKLDSTAIRWLT